MPRILSGIPLRDKIQAELSEIVSRIPEGAVPTLAIIQAGNHEASNVYIKRKTDFAKEIGVPTILHHVPESASHEEISSLISSLNADKDVGGILVQFPLPLQIDGFKLVNEIVPEKDIDGFHSNMLPPTARGIRSLLEYYGIPLKGKKVLVIGRSDLVGKPIARMCEQEGAMVTTAHKGTPDIPSLAREADIIISVTGQAGLITKEFVKEGQVIIDVGITRKEGKIVGDAAYDEIFPLVAAISPVPGGVGPLTVASLFQNLLRKYT